MKKKVSNKLLIDFFHPYGKPELSFKGQVALIAGTAIGIALALRILDGS